MFRPQLVLLVLATLALSGVCKGAGRAANWLLISGDRPASRLGLGPAAMRAGVSHSLSAGAPATAPAVSDHSPYARAAPPELADPLPRRRGGCAVHGDAQGDLRPLRHRHQLQVHGQEGRPPVEGEGT